MKFDSLFREMELRGYTEIRYSLFEGHMRGTAPDGEVHYFIVIDGDTLERIDS